MIPLDLPGYAIGGLSGGEAKDTFWRIVHQCTDVLPPYKPRYLMGVGYAIDMLVSVALGVDMFDCVFPTRTARFGSALIDSQESLNLKHRSFSCDYTPIDPQCDCYTCLHYTRAALHSFFDSSTKDGTAAQLVTQHNIRFQMRLMERLQQALLDGNFEQFVLTYVTEYHKKPTKHNPHGDIPFWCSDALRTAGVNW